MENRLHIAGAAAFMSVLGLASVLVDWRTGLMAGLLAAFFVYVPVLLEGLVPEELLARFRPALRPLGITALLVVTLTVPYLITPAFLAPDIPLAELEENLTEYGYRRVATEGELTEAEPYPMSIGRDLVFSLRIRSGQNQIRALYATGEPVRLPQVGQQIRLVGVVERYGGPKAEFVARSLEWSE